MDAKDKGPEPYVTNIENLTRDNTNFRTTKWTGKNLQMTLMSLKPGQEVGLEAHDTHDQFLRIEQGKARVEMGDSKDKLDYVKEAGEDFAVFVPAGKWHNLISIGEDDLKLYSIYAPPEHPAGTIHETYSDDPEHD